MAEGSLISPENVRVSNPGKPLREGEVLSRRDLSPHSKDKPEAIVVQLKYKKHPKILENEPGREIRLVRKKIEVMSGVPEGKTNAQAYFEKWQGIKNSGLPTVPTMRVISNNEVIMTDLTADGSVIYGKHDEKDLTKRTSPPADKLFMRINTQAIEVRARQIQKMADKQNITLPTDSDPFVLVVHPNGSWELVVLDVDMARFNDPEARTKNKELVSDFLNGIRSTKQDFINFSTAIPKYRWVSEQGIKPEKPTKIRYFLEKVKSIARRSA